MMSNSDAVPGTYMSNPAFDSKNGENVNLDLQCFTDQTKTIEVNGKKIDIASEIAGRSGEDLYTDFNN
jgi:hypothetical protein